jgi:hypothetical protein
MSIASDRAEEERIARQAAIKKALAEHDSKTAAQVTVREESTQEKPKRVHPRTLRPLEAWGFYPEFTDG